MNKLIRKAISKKEFLIRGMRSGLVFLFFCVPFQLLQAQSQQQQKQITKFAVVDVQKIYNTFKQNSGLMRDYEEKKVKYQNEIQVLSDEIIELKKKRMKLKASGNAEAVATLTEEITAKTNHLTEFSKAKNDELMSIKKSLNNDQFHASLYAVIKKVAVKEGYSMVVSLQDGSSILWYSPTVDITQDIIKELRKR